MFERRTHNWCVGFVELLLVLLVLCISIKYASAYDLIMPLLILNISSTISLQHCVVDFYDINTLFQVADYVNHHNPKVCCYCCFGYLCVLAFLPL